MNKLRTIVSLVLMVTLFGGPVFPSLAQFEARIKWEYSFLIIPDGGEILFFSVTTTEDEETKIRTQIEALIQLQDSKNDDADVRPSESSLRARIEEVTQTLGHGNISLHVILWITLLGHHGWELVPVELPSTRFGETVLIFKRTRID